jgi:hypothetical protein
MQRLKSKCVGEEPFDWKERGFHAHSVEFTLHPRDVFSQPVSDSMEVEESVRRNARSKVGPLFAKRKSSVAAAEIERSEVL